MPWPFFIPEFLKRRACRYLLHYYLGQFVEEKISLNDLTIDLYNGTGSVSNVPLNVETINGVLEEACAPVQVVSGYIGCVSISIPWSSLMSSSCMVEISGLCITVAPSYSQYNNNQVSMTDSLFFSMSKSRQLAEEVLKASPTTGEETTNGEEELKGFEGMEVLAKAIETILLRVQVSLVDTIVNVCQDGADTNTNELGIHVNKIEFFDEVTQMETTDCDSEEESDIQLPIVGDFATKILRLSGMTLELRDTTRTHDIIADSPCGVPIACANGEVDVRVKIKQSDAIPGPKLDVQVLLDSIHMLLYPQQLHSLIELLNGITKKFNKSKSSDHTHQSQPHSHTPGHSRPIPERDMRTIETQLIDHIDVQRKKKMAEEELLQLDPWDITARNNSNGLTESTYSNRSEMFYSFDLHNQELDDRSSKGVATNNGDNLVHSPLSRLHPTPHDLSKDQLVNPLSSTKVHSNPHGLADEVCIYSLTCGGLTCAILENTPVHTHNTRSNGDKVSPSDNGSEADSYSSAKADVDAGSLGSTSELCSLDEGGLDPFKYFDCVKDILKGRVGRKEIKNCEKILGQVLPADHIFLWMSTINSQVTVEGPSTELSLTMMSAELLEYLYHNEASLPLITPVSIQSLVQFDEDASSHDPCVSVHLSQHSSPANNYNSSSFPKSKYSSNVPVTTVDVSLTHVNVYLDVSIIDRLYALLHPTQTTNPHSSHISLTPSTYGTALYYPSVNIGIHGYQKKFAASQVLFSEAMSSTDSSTNVQKLCIKVKTKTLNTSLRFPVADLSQSVRPPWYRPPLRKEILFFEFIDLSLTSNILTPLTVARTMSGTTSFKTAKALFSQDGVYDNRQLFTIIASNSNNNTDNPKLQSVDMPSIKLTYQVLEDSPLESTHHNTSVDSDDEEICINTTHSEPSPFSQRKEKVLFGSDTINSNDKSITSSRHVVLPASPDEMSLYEDHVSSSSHFCLSVSIPSINIHIPSKGFLESLYNRISMDLLLWQPASPAAVEKATARSVFYSSADILQPAMTKDDKFKLCKSVLREDSEEEYHNDYTFSSLMSPAHSDSPKAPTFLMTSLTIDEGTVSMILPTKTEGVPTAGSSTLGLRLSPGPHLLDLSPRGSQCFSNVSSMDSTENGLMFVKINGCHICSSNNYEGETDRSQLCCKVDEMTVRHCGCVPQPLPLLVDSKTLQLDSDSFLKDVIIPWGSNEGTTRDPVLSISVDSRTENETNRRVHKVAVQLANSVFNYTPSLSHHSFFTQCGEFFNFTDITVAGYEPPTVITELYVSLKQSGLEYRPLHLPSHGILSFDGLNISTTLVTDSPLLVIDIIIDQMRLFISDKQLKTINLRKDFVCVMEMNIFQLALRMCNKTDISNESKKLFSNIPDIDLQCSGTELHMMFCVDSCAVFRDMIIYLAENKDLKEQVIIHDSHVTSPIVQGAEDENDPDVQPCPPPCPPDDVMVSSTIDDLITDAMDEDITNSNGVIDSNSGVSDKLYTSPTHLGARERHTTTMIFSSDSEEEERHHNVTTSSTGAAMAKQLKQKLAEEWEIDEDDYCILTSPTTTKLGPSAEPVVTCLLEEGESLELIDNYYTIPDAQIDQLKRPKHFPDPIVIYSLRELTIIWHLYGGRDFSIPPSPPSSCSPNTVKKHKMATATSHEDVAFHNGGGTRNSWKRKGGLGRDHDVLMEMELNKLRLQYECYPDGVEHSSRIVLLVHDIEIRDRLTVSRINKFLYHCTTEARPRQSHANMFSFKVVFSNPESETHSASKDSFQCLEASVQISMLPIRINIDQDAIFFLYDFFDDLLPEESNNNEPSNCSTSSVNSGPTPLLSNGPTVITDNSLSTQAPPTKNAAVFIKSFVFYPDVPIRIDYEAKRFHSKQLGTFTGMLLGLSHLDNSEVTLKALTYKNGVLGWNQLFEQVTAEWIQDIQRYQLPRILQGVGPVYHVTQLFQGAMDLFWLPVQQYQEDGRIIWGIQRGANSFVTSSGVAVVELSNRMLQSVEMVAKTAFDMVSVRERKQVSIQSLETPSTHQPADLREGIVNAYNVVSTGIGDTAWDLYDAASTEHNEYGVAGAVGGVLKNIPGTIVRPIIFMSEATRHVLGGVKNQFVPEARREANDKWKNS